MGDYTGQIICRPLSKWNHHIVGYGRQHDEQKANRYDADGDKNLPEVAAELKKIHSCQSSEEKM